MTATTPSPSSPSERELFLVLGRRLAVPLALQFDSVASALDKALGQQDPRVTSLLQIARRARQLHAASIDAVLNHDALRVAIAVEDTKLPVTGRLHAQALAAFGCPLVLQNDKLISIPSPAANEPCVPASASLARAWLERVQAMEAECVMGEDPEGPHQMRVAVRRLRSVLRLLERQHGVKGIALTVTRARALGDVAGAVRDHDVVLARVAKLHVPDEARMAAQAHLQTRRARALERMRRVLRSDNVATGISQSLTLLASLSQREDKRAMDEAAREHLDRTFRQFKRQCGEGIATAEAYHALRRRIRRVRDCIEVFASVLRKSDRAWRKRLQPVQSLLGDLNDIETAMMLVPASLARAAPVREALARQRMDTLTELAVPLSLTVVMALQR